MFKYEPKFQWNDDTKTTLCVIEDKKGNVFVGEAFCHEDDYDMVSKLVGHEIAFSRAKIQYLQFIRDNELKPALATLKQLYYSMKHSTHFNPKSYENRMLQRRIRMTEFDLTTTKEMIAYERKNLQDYTVGKEKLYQRIRRRKAEQQGQN